MTIFLIILLPLFLWANEKPKYVRGDCITPIVESYSWFGEYALVEAFSKIEGFGNEKSYVLSFPFSGSNSAIFSKEIEQVTKKVAGSFCGR